MIYRILLILVMTFAIFEKQQISTIFSESLEFSQTDIESEFSSVKETKDSDFINFVFGYSGLGLSFFSSRICIGDHIFANLSLNFISLRGPPKLI